MKRILLFVFLASSLAFLLSSCVLHRGVVVTSSGTVVRYHYWYYPSIQVYFDFDRRIYYYPENGVWYSGPTLPPHFHIGTPHVIVVEDTDRPYLYHDRHLKKYPYKPMIKKGKRSPGDRNHQDDRRDNDQDHDRGRDKR